MVNKTRYMKDMNNYWIDYCLLPAGKLQRDLLGHRVKQPPR